MVEANAHVDAYARLRTGPAIFEVKSQSETNELAQVRSALSQLYEYRFRYERGATLWIVLSRPLGAENDWLSPYLQDDRGIGVLWMGHGGRLDGPWLQRLEETIHAREARLAAD